MRGALEPLPGISNVDISVGNPEFKVEYDPKKVSVDQIVTALTEAGATNGVELRLEVRVS